MDETNTAYKSRGKTSLVFAVVFTALIAGVLGYVVGNKTAARVYLPQATNLNAPQPNNQNGDSVIVSQEAVATGKITNVSANGITMQGKDGKFAGFKLAQNYNIYPLAASSSAAPKGSQDISSVKLNQNYIVHLVLQNGNFVATTIQALTPSTK